MTSRISPICPYTESPHTIHPLSGCAYPAPGSAAATSGFPAPPTAEPTPTLPSGSTTTASPPVATAPAAPTPTSPRLSRPATGSPSTPGDTTTTPATVNTRATNDQENHQNPGQGPRTSTSLRTSPLAPISPHPQLTVNDPARMWLASRHLWRLRATPARASPLDRRRTPPPRLPGRRRRNRHGSSAQMPG